MKHTSFGKRQVSRVSETSKKQHFVIFAGLSLFVVIVFAMTLPSVSGTTTPTLADTQAGTASSIQSVVPSPTSVPTPSALDLIASVIKSDETIDTQTTERANDFDSDELSLQQTNAFFAAPITVASRANALMQFVPIHSSDENLKQEYLKNRRAPQSMLSWAGDIGRLQLEAFEDSAKAEELFEVLKSCSLDSTKATPYRAVCAGNAKRLVTKYPQKFGRTFAGVEREMPESIRSFLERMKTASN